MTQFPFQFQNDTKMATSREALIEQIVDLTRLIDSHRNGTREGVAPYGHPFIPAHHRPRMNSTHFPQNSNIYVTSHPLPRDSSVYALNRTTRPRPSYQGSGYLGPMSGSTYLSNPNQISSVGLMGHQLLTSQISPNLRQTSRIVNKFQVRTQNLTLRRAPTCSATPGQGRPTSVGCLLNTSVTNNSAQSTIAASPSQLQAASTHPIVTRKLTTTERPATTSTLKTARGKPSQSQVLPTQNIFTSKVAITKIPTPKSTPLVGRGLQLRKTATPKSPRKSGTPVSARKSSVGALRVTRFKYVRPDSASRTSANSKTPPSASVASSKYKLVVIPCTSKPKPTFVQPVKSPVRRQGRASKYSWTQGGSQVLRRSPSGQNFVRSRYRLSKTSVGVSPKLVRRVNKYSVKYLPSSRRASPRALAAKLRFQPGSYFTQGQHKGKSDLVVIGSILYKSSKTKLSRTADERQHCPANQRIITVRGERFSMDINRKVLQRLSTTEQKPQRANRLPSNGPVSAAHPKGLTRIDIGGETYIQTRPGVLVRSSTNQLRSLANRVVNRSICRLRASKGKAQQFCLFFNKFGKCNNKEKGLCPYIHDPDKIAVCKRFLSGECTVERCPFSHTACSSKMPVCKFFLHGRCNNDSCNYRHVNVNPNADFCSDFAKGYCPQGDKCKNWHVSVCPQFERTGKCDRSDKCPLKHKRRVAKGTKRYHNASTAASDPGSSADEATTGKPSTDPRHCPSFISLRSDSDIDTPPHKVQKVSQWDDDLGGSILLTRSVYSGFEIKVTLYIKAK